MFGCLTRSTHLKRYFRNKTSQLTKCNPPLLNILSMLVITPHRFLNIVVYHRKLTRNEEVATRHHISTHEVCQPQDSPFYSTWYNTLFKMCVCTCPHLAYKSHLIFIKFYTYFNLGSSSYTYYMFLIIIYFI